MLITQKLLEIKLSKNQCTIYWEVSQVPTQGNFDKLVVWRKESKLVVREIKESRNLWFRDIREKRKLFSEESLESTRQIGSHSQTNALETYKVSFDGREPGDTFVYMQEVDTILSWFAYVDISEQRKCRVAIAGMKSPARETTATNVQVGNEPDKLYIALSDSIFEMYM